MSARKWQTLTESLAELERTDPAVAEASRHFDETVARLNYDAALHRFRPLPWDRLASCTRHETPAPPP